MEILLDTNILLWAVTSPGRLSGTTAERLVDGANKVFFSAVNILEIAIKFGLQRPDFTAEPEAIARQATDNGFVGLPVDIAAAQGVARLPLHHRDPFDRLLIAQALAGPMHFYTSDAALVVYSDLVHLVR